MDYPILFSPLKLKENIVLRNRVVMSSMNTNFAKNDGFISNRYAQFYIERAKGGVGLIIVAPGYVDPRSRKRACSLRLDEERFLSHLKKFTNKIHQYGSLILQQLNHNGRLLTSSSDFKTSGGLCIGPSAIPHKITGDVPSVMTREDIKFMVKLFVKSSKNAHIAGYDGVEIHGAHGYLINQFLSRYSNKREDEYGGSIENRMRFALEIIKEIRRAMGDDFIISFRLEAMEYNPDGVNIEEAKILAKALERAGVDLLNVTAGNSETTAAALKMFPPTSVPQGCYNSFSKAIKKVVNVPVSIIGRIATPERAEEILKANESDLVTIGRGLFADAHWVNKCSQGRRQELRQCIGCLRCYEEMAKNVALTCLYNPFLGKEYEPFLPSKIQKKIWVIGGGPSGLETARVATLRGHKVELFEAQEKLGGQINIASIPPGKSEFNEIIRFYNHELNRLGVKINLGCALTADDVIKSSAQVVVIAVGSDSLTPNIPGIQQNNVVSARDVLLGFSCNENIVICGGNLVGVETALHLDKNNKNITLIEMREKLLLDTGPLNKTRLFQEIDKSSIKIFTNTKLTKIDGDKVVLETSCGEKNIYADTIVLALGAKAKSNFERELKERNFVGSVYAVGDCVTPRDILEAVAEGARIAMQI